MSIYDVFWEPCRWHLHTYTSKIYVVLGSFLLNLAGSTRDGCCFCFWNLHNYSCCTGNSDSSCSADTSAAQSVVFVFPRHAHTWSWRTMLCMVFLLTLLPVPIRTCRNFHTPPAHPFFNYCWSIYHLLPRGENKKHRN